MQDYPFLHEAIALKPLYADLLQSVCHFNQYDLVPFCIQWGKYFPKNDNSGIIFYGRATNGWVTFERDVDRLFDLGNDCRIFARDDQMQWVDDCAGAKQDYNSNKSPFWRVIRATASKLYTKNEIQHIAWSNVCKIAINDANPSDSLYYAQLFCAQKIMKKEIEIFSPKHVVLLTGEGWAKDFLFFLNGNQTIKAVENYTWGTTKRFAVKVYKIGDTYFYLSEHPQRKNELTHVEALVKAIKQRLD